MFLLLTRILGKTNSPTSQNNFSVSSQVKNPLKTEVKEMLNKLRIVFRKTKTRSRCYKYIARWLHVIGKTAAWHVKLERIRQERVNTGEKRNNSYLVPYIHKTIRTNSSKINRKWNHYNLNSGKLTFNVDLGLDNHTLPAIYNAQKLKPALKNIREIR